ncbi:MAG: EamA family transporter [Sulfobacillus thermosulfidooxidans]|uniref:EamA family transporter n=1 Tax=Sulfobacillus thermosulfidooxidans TaxID=28034 RepID=A0A2T2WT07_SULTH|nr:MAG: EamA family transporter [Sulfobacillus thermosulfidooxidans]
MSRKLWGNLFLAVAASIWGGMYVVSKVVLTKIPPVPLVWLRYVLGIAALIVVGKIWRVSWRIERRDWLLIGILGLVGYTISIWAQFLGTALSTAQWGAIITAATPAFMVIFAYGILKEPLTWAKVASVVLASLGVVMIVGLGPSTGNLRLGGMILVVAALTWALLSVLIKKVPAHYSLVVITTYALGVATVLLTPFALPWFLEHAVFMRFLSPGLWWGIVYLGVISTAVAFFLWNQGLSMVEAGNGAVYFFFQPLTGTLLGWFFLHERPNSGFWLGALLIVMGVWLVIKQERKTTKKASYKV